jgi:hypothetical protein
MGSRNYGHFSLEDRQVAAALDRSPSSVARELKRKAASGSYAPTYAGSVKACREACAASIGGFVRDRTDPLGELEINLVPRRGMPQ